MYNEDSLIVAISEGVAYALWIKFSKLTRAMVYFSMIKIELLLQNIENNLLDLVDYYLNQKGNHLFGKYLELR